MEEESPKKHFYYVKDGEITLYKRLGNYTEIIVRKIKPGEWFGELTFFGNFANNITSAKCSRKAILIELDQSDF